MPEDFAEECFTIQRWMGRKSFVTAQRYATITLFLLSIMVRRSYPYYRNSPSAKVDRFLPPLLAFHAGYAHIPFDGYTPKVNWVPAVLRINSLGISLLKAKMASNPVQWVGTT